MEVNYLLQRIEEFSGVVILATNLRQNIDEAFLRRIHVFVDFPQPGPDCRAAIWRALTPPVQERAFADDELDRLAYRFELSGGNIRNVMLDARFRARAANANLSLRDIADSIAREYEKLGRPITNSEFGDEFYAWVVEDILDPPVKGVSVN
jgi:SpoVK/Ycf46/Vps4 family AAA+-type ATPase